MPASRTRPTAVNPTWEIRQGNALEVLRRMPSESVHCVVTSQCIPSRIGYRCALTLPYAL